MPKTRLQTQWDSDAEVWKIFTSLNAGSRGPAIVIKDRANGKTLDPATDKIKIKRVLEADEDYKTVKTRIDNNETAVLTKNGKQKPKPGFHTEATIILLGAAVIIPILTGITDLTMNSIQRNQNSPLSFKQAQAQSAINFTINLLVAILGVGSTIRLLHLKHSKIMDAENAYEINKNLLGRLDDIEKEVKLKNKVLSRVVQFVEVNLQHSGHLASADNDSFIKEIKNRTIMALDSEDDLDCWQSVDQTLGTTESRLQLIYPHIFKEMVSVYKEEHEFFRNDEPDGSSPVFDDAHSNLIELFKSAEEASKGGIDFMDKKLPVDFIFSHFAQSLQNRERWLVQETLQKAFQENKKIVNGIAEEMTRHFQVDPAAAKAGCEYINNLSPKKQNILKNVIENFLKQNMPMSEVIDMIMDQNTLKVILANPKEQGRFSELREHTESNAGPASSSSTHLSSPLLPQSNNIRNDNIEPVP